MSSKCSQTDKLFHDMLIDRVRRYIDQYHLIAPGDLVLAGVSGGPDSIFLLHALMRILPDYSSSLHVLHLDHGLRGDDSAADARFVASLASSLKLPCSVERRPVSSFPDDGSSTQEKARRVRMTFFREMKSSLGGDKIALGHTADDQAETVVLRLLTGGASGAIAGIKSRGEGGIIHPLLDVRKEDLLVFLKGNSIDYRIDQSNQSGKYLRNRIRHEVIPPILAINPSFSRRIASLSRIMEDDDNYLSLKALEVFDAAAECCGNCVELSLDQIVTLPRPILRRLISLSTKRAGVPQKNFRAAHVEGVISLLAGPSGRLLALPGGYQAIRTSRRLHIRPEQEIVPAGSDIKVNLPGITRAPALGIHIEATPALLTELDDLPEDPRIAIIDADKINGPLKVRSRKPGDRFYPLGFGHRKKVKNLLIDLKIEFHTRDRVPILADDQKIVWVGGIRIDDRVRITPSTRRAWRIELLEES